MSLSIEDAARSSRRALLVPNFKLRLSEQARQVMRLKY
jgi:hypothetical protein